MRFEPSAHLEIMLRTNHFQEGACYRGATIRKVVALNMIVNGYGIFRSASVIKELDNIEKALEQVHVDPSRYFLGDAVTALDPPILDATKILLCFENFLKAELLLRGIVIHKIESNGVPSDVLSMSKDQKKRPITLVEYKKGEGISRKKNFLELKHLRNGTLGIYTLINVDEYRKRFKLPRKLFDALERIRIKRNSLHFLTFESFVFNRGIIAEYKLINSYVNKRVASRANKLMASLDYPRSSYLPNIEFQERAI